MTIDIPDDFEELISELLDCDGFSNGVMIYSHTLAAHLQSRGLVDHNIRGHYYTTPLLEYIYNEIANGDISVIIQHIS